MEGHGHDKVIVIDNGTSFMKAGLAGDARPSVVFATLACNDDTPHNRGAGVAVGFVGQAALPFLKDAHTKRPIRRGRIKHWDHIELIWEHIFSQHMHLEASEHPVLLSESIRGKKKHREKMAEIMFERFRVPSLSIMPQPLMSLRASDRASGVVVDIGDSGSHIVPIHEYQIQHNAIAYMKIGGQDLTKYLRDLLQARGYSFSTQSDFEIVRDIKENLCYLSTSYDRDIHELKTTTNIDKSFELSDGQIISQIDIERIKCAEPLFRPSLLGLEMPGIHGQIANSVRKCPLSMYSALYKCVQLSGASTKFANFRTRLHEGISRSVSRKSQIVVKEPPNRDVLCWIGGSKLASSASEFEPFLTQNSDYQERGPASIHRQ